MSYKGRKRKDAELVDDSEAESEEVRPKPAKKKENRAKKRSNDAEFLDDSEAESEEIRPKPAKKKETRVTKRNNDAEFDDDSEAESEEVRPKPAKKKESRVTKRNDAEFLDDSGAESQEERKKPAKKVPKKKDHGPDGIVACELSKNRKVTVRQFQGKTLIDIREYYDRDGEARPGKKGISLSLDQWNKLRDHINDIDEAIEELG